MQLRHLGAFIFVTAIAFAACGPAEPDCGPNGHAHGDHCHCDSGFKEEGDTCVPDGKGGADAGTPDAGAAPDAGGGGSNGCDDEEVRVGDKCLPDDADGCGPNGEAHDGHCHCEPSTFAADGVLYCITPGACVGTDDTREPNDTPAQATTWDRTWTSVQGHMCPGNDDWFAVPLQAGETLAVELDFSHAAGDLDTYLWKEGADVTHSRPVASSESTDDDEAFDFTATQAGTYWLLVTGYRGAEAPYTLTLSFVAP